MNHLLILIQSDGTTDDMEFFNSIKNWEMGGRRKERRVNRREKEEGTKKGRGDKRERMKRDSQVLQFVPIIKFLPSCLMFQSAPRAHQLPVCPV